jgi:hypothetical protein
LRAGRRGDYNQRENQRQSPNDRSHVHLLGGTIASSFLFN